MQSNAFDIQTQVDGMVEQVNQMMVDIALIMCKGDGTRWLEHVGAHNQHENKQHHQVLAIRVGEWEENLQDQHTLMRLKKVTEQQASR